MKLNWRTDNPPDERCQYLVTYWQGGMDICWWSNSGLFNNSTADWHWNAAQYCKVIAWMPLPEEYNGSQWVIHSQIKKYQCESCGSFIEMTKEDYDGGQCLPNFCYNCGAKMENGGE